ncbi:TetR/AcrR family transcriptional regulator [Pantoea sp. B65]|uniref:TetR/AcrR family transcriptional regulator n=1 Tax=Pantoea sp. B65 TaxID=2813359 RepID=UPI0039B6CD76
MYQDKELSVTDRKTRQRAEREALIITVTREIAEREGWNAVTIRRLAEEIEYSQPVLYSHFQNRDAIVAAVALQGFGELAEALSKTAESAKSSDASIKSVAYAYLDFALSRPALYEAMFVLPSELLFAQSDTKPQLKAAFSVLVETVSPYGGVPQDVAETYWAALHGLSELERSGRIRSESRDRRVNILVKAISSGQP